MTRPWDAAVGDAEDSGSVTAEFVLGLPAVLALLLALLTGVHAVGLRADVQEAARSAAREAARGADAAEVAAAVHRVSPAASHTLTRQADLVTVEVTREGPGWASLRLPPLTARATVRSEEVPDG